jgi:hypothetical protein
MLEKTIIENLLLIVAAYRKATKKSLNVISHEFYGRGDFFSNLKDGGKTIRLNKLSEMLDKFRDEWPEGAEWPITRPIFMSQKSPK